MIYILVSFTRSAKWTFCYFETFFEVYILLISFFNVFYFFYVIAFNLLGFRMLRIYFFVTHLTLIEMACIQPLALLARMTAPSLPLAQKIYPCIVQIDIKIACSYASTMSMYMWLHAWLKLVLSTPDLKLSKGLLWSELPNFLLGWANGAHFTMPWPDKFCLACLTLRSVPSSKRLCYIIKRWREIINLTKSQIVKTLLQLHFSPKAPI